MLSETGKIEFFPSLVIALDKFSCTVAADAEEILRGSRLKTGLQEFLFMRYSDGKCSFSEKNDWSQSSLEEGDMSTCASARILASASGLKNELSAALHSLQVHENLIEQGYTEYVHLPLNIYVLVDFTFVEAEAFFPVLLMVNSFLSEIPNGKGHLLINLASFAEGDEAVRVNALSYRNLQKLDVWLESGATEEKRKLAEDFDVEISSFHTWQVFLFDRYKEGLWEAKDDDEVRVIAGNFLLACLSSALNATLEQNIIQVEKDNLKAHYSSASANALVYEPGILHRRCAYKLGEKLLSLEFVPDFPLQTDVTERQVKKISQELGTIWEWVSDILDATPFYLTSEDLLTINHNLPRVDFGDLPFQEWVYAISADHECVLEKEIPNYLEKLISNALKMSLSLPDDFSCQLSLLPGNPDIYPDGILASKAIIFSLKNALLERVNRFAQKISLLPDIEEVQRRFEGSLEKLENAIESFPSPPFWIVRLPFQLKDLGISLYNALFLRQEYQHLLALREKSLELSDCIYAQMMEKEAFEQLAQIAGSLCDPADEILGELDRLCSVFASVQLHFEKEARGVDEKQSPFRLSLLSPESIGRIYQDREPSIAAARASLLRDGEFLSDWKKVDDLTLAKRLLDFCLDVYQSVRELSLGTLLFQHEQLDMDAAALFLSRGLLPLLRITFDHLGVGYSTQAKYFLFASAKKSDLYQKLRYGEQEWQALESNNPFAVFGIQVRQMIPLNALVHIKERGERAMKQLENLRCEKEDR